MSGDECRCRQCREAAGRRVESKRDPVRIALGDCPVTCTVTTALAYYWRWGGFVRVLRAGR